VGLTVLDAGVLIAVLDRTDAHHEAATAALRSELDSGSTLVVPASAYAEVVVGPARRGAAAIATVDAFLDALPATIEPLSRPIAATAARVRARRAIRSDRGRGVRLPDALVIATALAIEADVILTTDRGWPPRLGVPVKVVGGG
jgi:predicted nucleic acid-binding protein